MTELRQIITNLKTVDGYLDQFLHLKNEEFKKLIEENNRLRSEIEKLKAGK